MVQPLSSRCSAQIWRIFTEVENCWKERLLQRNLPRVVEMITKEVDDERQREQQQEIAAAAENRLVGRPARLTDMHGMHRVKRRSTGRSTAIP